VEGTLYLANGQTTTVTPGGSPATLTLSSGSFVDVAGASTLAVNGNVINSGTFYTGYGGGGNTVTVTGAFTNNGSLYMFGETSGDTLTVDGTFTNNAGATADIGYYNTGGSVANVGALTNDGYLQIGPGSTLNITGGGPGITDVVAGSSLDVAGTFELSGDPSQSALGSLTSIEGTLTLENGQITTVTPGSGTLTVASGGNLNLYDTYGATTLSVNGTLDDLGSVYIGPGTTLNLATGITDLPGSLTVYGTINSGGSSALAGLTSVEGDLYLVNGQTTTVTPGGSPATLTLNSGSFVDVAGASTLAVNGNVINSGTFYTGYSYGGGGNTVTVTGAFTNNGSLDMFGSVYGGTSGDTLTVDGTFTNNAGATAYIGYYYYSNPSVANVGALTNDGYLQIGPGSTLNITGGGPGITDVVAGSSLDVAGTFELSGDPSQSALGSLTSIEGTLTLENGQTTTVMPGSGTLTVAPGGNLNLSDTYGATTLSVNGTLNDLGTVDVGTGTTLNLATGITDLPGTLYVYGTINSGGSSALAGLTSVEGDLYLVNGQTTTVTPGGSPATLTLNSGSFVDVAGASTLAVNGNVINSGSFYTGYSYGGGGNTVTVTGAFTNNGYFYMLGSAYGGTSGDTLTVDGTFTNNAGATADIGYYYTGGSVANVGALTNNGSLQIDTGSTLNITGAGTSSNSGTVYLYGGTLAGSNASATFNNTGTIATEGGPSAPSTLTFAGTFTNAIGGTVNLNYAGDAATMPTLGNGGTVNVAAGALLGVGTGAFASGGGFQLLSNGTLNENIENISASGFGVLNITGPVSLAGQLDITLLSGFNPTGDTFDILNYTGALTGVFSNGTSFMLDGYDWTLTYDPGEVLLSASEIAGAFTATWSSGSGHWTDSSLWSCNPTLSPCKPNNTGGTNFIVDLDAPGYGLTLDSTDTPSTININSLSLGAGTLTIGSGATLNLTDQPGGIIDIPSGAGLIVAGTFTTGGTTNALAGLTTVEGYLGLDGQTLSITPGGGTLTNSGTFAIGDGTRLTVTGNVTNSGFVNTGYDVSGGSNVLDVTGTFNNSGTFYVYGSGDQATVAALNNSGDVDVFGNGDVLNVTGALTNSGSVTIYNGGTLNLAGGPGITDVVAGSSLDVAGTFEIGGDPSVSGLENLGSIEGTLTLENGQTTTVTPGSGTLTVASGGYLNLYDSYGATTLSVNGTLDDLGSVYIGTGTTLNLTTGITDVAAGSSIYDLGTINGLGGLTSVEGLLELDGQSITDTPGGGSPGTLTVASGGDLQVNDGSTLTVDGNLANSGYVYTGLGGGSESALDVNGTLTNSGIIGMYGAGDSLNATGALTNSGSIEMYGAGESLTADLTNSGPIGLNGASDTLTVTGDFNNNSGGSLSLTANLNSVGVSGNFNNNAGASVTMSGTNGGLSAAGAFTNGGTVALSGSGDILSANSFANSGTVTVGSGERLSVTNTYTQTGGSTDVTGNLNATTYQHNGGATTIELGGTISATTFNVTGGGVQGNGTIIGAVAMTGGTLTPGSLTGNTPGTLTINGSFNQTGGTFDELISPMANGLLAVNGGASLGGTAGLQINLVDGFSLASGDSFDILNYSGGLSGVWANAPTSGFIMDGFDWGIDYAGGASGDEVVITAEGSALSPTPEPGTLLLYGTGLLGIAGFVRRKRFAAR
jgi:hypothetical protein